MKTFIVVFYSIIGGRELANQIENIKIKLDKPKDGCETLTAFKVMKHLTPILNNIDNSDEDISFAVFPISDFMEEFNDSELDSSLTFISYIQAEYKG